MSRPRLINGNLVYPSRGEPPTLLEGYSRDPGNPYILRLDFPSCSLRVLESKRLPCGKVIESYTCLKDLEVTAQNCVACKERIA